MEKLAQGELPHEEDLRGALTNDTDEGQKQKQNQSSTNPAGPVTPGATPSTEGQDEQAPSVAPEVIGDVEQDYQLARAVDLLRGLWLFNARATN